MTTLYAMTVDTEEEWDWGQDWPTQELSLSNIYQLPQFQAVCSHHGVRTTYFTNQAVLDDTRAADTMDALRKEEGVEIGMHIHPWNTPPIAGSGHVHSRDTYLRNLDSDLILAKLAVVYESFEKGGMRPTSFRGGRYSSGGPIHEFLRDRGFLADSSIVPFTSWAEKGAPDYRNRDLSPSRMPPRFPGDGPFWEIPLTLGFTRRHFGFWAKCFDFIEHSWLRRLHLIGIAERTGLVQRVWLNFEDPQGYRMLDLLHILRPMALPSICFTVHSSSLTAGKGPYTPTQADEDRLFAQLNQVFGTIAKWPDFRPATISEIARQMEQNYHASLGN
jgi:hypothetical protein